MITAKSLTEERDRKLAQLKQQMLETDKYYADEIQKAEELGGFVDREQIARLLDVSAARVSVLINRGQFRSYGPRLFSLADVEAYKKNRRVGRPAKGTKKHEAPQSEMFPEMV